MGVRYSIKWLLGGMVYTAFAAAAFAQAHWSYADVLWGMTFFAVVYALMRAIFARGRRQGAAAGFAIASILLTLCLHFAPDSLPTGRIIVLAATGQPAPAPRNTIVLYSDSSGYSPLMGAGMIQRKVPIPVQYPEQDTWLVRYRTLNAVFVLIVGLIGCVLGALSSSSRPEIEI